MNFKKQNGHVLKYIPTVGIGIFILLFVFSASLYPGGSQANPNSVGYSWVHNYWCNLMNIKAENGLQNPARPYAISAMLILCASLMVFFIQFSNHLATHPFWKKMIKWGGGFSMFFAFFIFSDYHDLMTIISSIFGLFVVIGVLVEIYKSDLKVFKTFGILCLILLAINNGIYYSNMGIEWLPLIQKFTFLVALGWIVGLNRKLHL